MRLVVGGVDAGLVIAVASAIGLVFGIYRLLRSLGVRRGVAVPACFFALATVSGQWGLTTIRADLLPAALNVWGLWLCTAAEESPSYAHSRPSSIPLERAACLFLLAFAAKITSLYACAAVIAALYFAGRKSQALRLLFYMALGIAGFVGIMHYCTGGRFIASFRACAHSGGDAKTLVWSPITMLVLAMKNDPMAPLFWLLAAAALLHGPWKTWSELSSLSFLAAGAMTLLIFASPGIAVNHLIDLHVMALIFFVVQCSRQRLPTGLGLTALALAALLATAGTAQKLHGGDNVEQRTCLAGAAAQARQAGGKVLCENPAIPILAGQSAFMLDPFMFAVISQKRPDIGADLMRRIENREFSAIILSRDPSQSQYQQWFDVVYFGVPFRRKLLENYHAAENGAVGDFLYLPNP